MDKEQFLKTISVSAEHRCRVATELARPASPPVLTSRADHAEALRLGRFASAPAADVQFALLPSATAVAQVKNHSLSMQEFLAFFRHSDVPAPKEGKMIVGATFAPAERGESRRCDAQVLAHHVLILDFDGEMSLADAIDLFGRYTGAAYSSHSHRVPEPPRFRIILPLARSISMPQYRALADWIIEALGYVAGADGKMKPRIDGAVRRPSQGYYLPRTATPGEAWSFFWVGAGCLDPLLIDQVASATVAVDPKKAPPLPARNGSGAVSRYIPSPALRALKSLGMVARDVLADDDHFLRCRVSCCPMCKRSEGAPALNEAGRLTCFRETCEAAGGISMHGWISETAPVALQLPRSDAADVRSFATVEDARQELQRLLQQAVPDDTIRVIVASPGIGKTHSVADALRLNGAGTYLAPTHGLLRQFEKMLGVPATHLNSAAQVCKLPAGGSDKVRLISDLGYSATMSVCRSCVETGCPVHPSQTSAAMGPIILATHAKEMTSRPNKLAKPKFFDEAPQLIERREISLTDLEAWTRLAEAHWDSHSTIQPWLDERKDLFVALATVARQTTKTIENEEVAAALSTQGDFLELIALNGKVPSPPASAVEKGYLNEHYPPINANTVLGRIVRGDDVVLHPQSGYVVRSLLPVAHFFGATILDATGDYFAAELRAAYPKAKVEVIQIDVAEDEQAVSRQILWDRMLTRRALIVGNRLAKGAEGTIANALRQVDHLPGGLGIVTMKPIADALRLAVAGKGYPKLTSALARWGKDIHIEHYGATRGSNGIKGMRTLIIFGDGLENIDMTRADAAFLGLEGDQLVESRLAAELLQAEGRARPLLATREAPVRIVYVGSRCPPGESWSKLLVSLDEPDATVARQPAIKKMPKGRPPGEIHQFLKDAVAKGISRKELTPRFMKDAARHKALGLRAPDHFSARTFSRAKKLLPR